MKYISLIYAIDQIVKKNNLFDVFLAEKFTQFLHDRKILKGILKAIDINSNLTYVFL